jgi:hypothetical protein
MLVSLYVSQGGTPYDDTLNDGQENAQQHSENNCTLCVGVKYLLSTQDVTDYIVGKSHHHLRSIQNANEEPKNPKYNACSWIGLGCITLLIVVLLTSDFDFNIWDEL